MRIGEVIIVVTSAMITSIVNRRGVMHAEVEADVEDDQLDQAARVHQDAERGAVAPVEAGQPRAASVVPPNFPTVATTMITRAQQPVVDASARGRSRCAGR